MDEIRFVLHIDADTMLAYYRGHLRQVQVRGEDGRSLRLPLRFLQPFLTAGGVHGRFRLLHERGRLLQLERCPCSAPTPGQRGKR